MTFQFDKSLAKPVVPPEGEGELPLGSRQGHLLRGEFVNLRFSTQNVEGRSIVCALQVEAVHPKIVDDKRVYDLSFLLPRLQKSSPSTVAQIVNPTLSMDSRIDALRIAVVNIAKVTEHIAPLNQPRYATGQLPSVDGLEPSFAVKQVVLTQLPDIVRGYARRGITVVRNGEPWVQFLVIENEGGLCDASIVVLPSGLELPLLDFHGHSVTTETLSGSIHDLTHLLLKGRYESELKVLESLAAELSRRLDRNPDAPKSLTKRNFEHEIVLASRDGVLWASDNGGKPNRGGNVPTERDFKARELPDGRVLWIRHQTQRLSSEITLVTDSLEGAQYLISFHYPPHAHPKVASVARELSKGAAWPLFQGITDLLHQVPRSGLSIVIPTSSDIYPPGVNALMREVHRVVPEVSFSRGLFRLHLSKFDHYLPDFISELVKGRSPFMGVVESSDPTQAWWVQGFLDRDMRGTLFAVNGLGGTIVVSDHASLHSSDSQRSRLVKFFKTLADDSAQLTQNPNFTTDLRESRRNLPVTCWSDAMAYSHLSDTIARCWAALVREGGFSSQHNPVEASWSARRLREGVWSVSLLTRGGSVGWLPHLINFTVTKDGVMELAFSSGRRGPLGGLRGSRVWAQAARPIESELVYEVVRLIAQGAKGQLPQSFGRTVQLLDPSLGASLFPWSSLREADPEHDRHNVLRRLWNALRGIW